MKRFLTFVVGVLLAAGVVAFFIYAALYFLTGGGKGFPN